MAAKVPESVRVAIGEEAAIDMVPWVEEVAVEVAVPRDEYRQVLSRLDVLERDVSDIKVDVRDLRREMNERFNRIHERLDKIYRHVDSRSDAMNRRMDEQLGEMNRRMDRRFNAMNRRMMNNSTR